VDRFTIRKEELSILFNKNKWQETAAKCAQYIGELNDEDFAVFSQIRSYYKIMYDCYFRLSDKTNCEEVLKIWIRYARGDEEEIYRIHFANVILGIVTGDGIAKLPLLDQCIGRYKSVNRTKQVADLLVWKGIATNDAKYCKEAYKLYDECENATEADKAFALSKIKELRHLY
jgi:hypothetical protein